MHSFIQTFALILAFFVVNSFGQKQSIKRLICNQSVDSAVTPVDTEYVYLTSGDLIYKVLITTSEQAVIKSVKKLKDLSKEIETPIETMYWTKVRPNDITLTNCLQKNDFIIKYADNEYIRSEPALLDCWHHAFGFIIEYVVDPLSGGHHLLKYREKVLFITMFGVNGEFPIIRLIRDKNQIQIKTDRKKDDTSEAFSGFGEDQISAGFIHDEHWHLFGGQHFCRVHLNDQSFAECKPILISDWIKDCSDNSGTDEEESEDESKNTDISLFIIIMVLIVVIAVIVIFVILVYIFREMSKQSTNKKSGQSSGASGGSVASSLSSKRTAN